MNPLVSVVVLAYNVEEYVAQAIESVLEQVTTFDYEIVVGEDCSTDNTRQIVASYAAKYPQKVRPIYHERNLGFMQNSKATVSAARGEYLAFCDGDDYWCCPEKLEKQVKQISEGADCDLVHSNFYILWPNGTKALAYPDDYKEGYLEPSIMLCEQIFMNTYGIRQSAAMLRKRVWDALDAADPEWLSGQRWNSWDASLFASIARRNRIGYLAQPFTVYRRRDDSECRAINNPAKDFAFERKFLTMNDYYCNRLGFDQKSRDEVIDYNARVAFRRAWSRKNTEMLRYMYNLIRRKSLSDRLRMWTYDNGAARRVFSQAMNLKARINGAPREPASPFTHLPQRWPAVLRKR